MAYTPWLVPRSPYPAAYTPQPAPHTPQPIPRGLHPTACASWPTPRGLYPAACTPWPAPHSLHPVACTPQPAPRGLHPTGPGSTGLPLAVESGPCNLNCHFQRNHTPTPSKVQGRFPCQSAADHTGSLSLHSAVSNAGAKGSPEPHSAPVIIKIFKATGRACGCALRC